MWNYGGEKINTNLPVYNQAFIFNKLYYGMFFRQVIIKENKKFAMLYFERSYKVLNQINRLSSKIVYDTIKPFIEAPPVDRQLNVEKETEEPCAADLFSRFTADIINANVLFIR